MEARIVAEVEPVRLFASKTNSLRIVIDEKLDYWLDMDAYNAQQFVLLRDEIRISTRECTPFPHRTWEILRNDVRIAKVDERYGVCKSDGLYDVEWNGRIYKSYQGMEWLSSAPSLRQDSLIPFRVSWRARNRARYFWIDELDPDIAAMLSLDEFWRN